MDCVELWDCTVLAVQLFVDSACIALGCGFFCLCCFGCLVLKYFDLSAEPDCSYRVLRLSM